MVREVINIFVGQAGCQIGNAAWELYCLEHGFEPNGRFRPGEDVTDATFEAFYAATPSGQYVPRALFIDLEPSVIDEIRVGTYKSLFHPDLLISGNEDAANNFARGYYSIGNVMYDRVMNVLRKLTDSCENIQAFLIHHSYGGGSGSGFTSGLCERLSQEYGKRTKLSIGVYPSPSLSTAVVEPYNATLAAHCPIEHIDSAFFFDNESMYNICQRFLSINNPNYTHINRIVTQVLSSITASLRFSGELHASICDFQTNLIPYPRIHFPFINFAPIVSKDRADHQALTTMELTRTVFERDNQLMKCDPLSGKYMSCCLLYRGDVSPRDVNYGINEIKKNNIARFVDWCPTGFKVGINNQPTTAVPSSGLAMTRRSVCMLANNTAMGTALARLNRKFELLFSKRAFVHWFIGEGMEEGELNEARESLLGIEQDYMEVGYDSSEPTYTGEEEETNEENIDKSNRSVPSDAQHISYEEEEEEDEIDEEEEEAEEEEEEAEEEEEEAELGQ